MKRCVSRVSRPASSSSCRGDSCRRQEGQAGRLQKAAEEQGCDAAHGWRQRHSGARVEPGTGQGAHGRSALQHCQEALHQLLRLCNTARQKREAVPSANEAAVCRVVVQPAAASAGKADGTAVSLPASCGAAPRVREAAPLAHPCPAVFLHLKSASSSPKSSGVLNKVSCSLMGRPARRARSRPARAVGQRDGARRLC